MRCVLLLAVLLLMPRFAQAADDAAREAAKATVERQIDAFRRDDAATAYAQAAPAIQGLFPSSDTFVAMVRDGYAAIYRARRYSVDRIEDAGDAGLSVGVSLQDQDGVDWAALYSLEKQPDGAWRITGCRLLKVPGSRA
ncbi:DUF4864 domain-containing protein [Methylobacterium sp. 37f]|uniref:DUF4864 domain-containing protein n=1 Tax=Methylobacterium sp. 37f TaxID=2817058 RepID=UPI001FFC9365|nr:DUF4864 domain-containing protein [Methylobacterium sp. 37f]MCK2055428.1 DUF4864 domain-containing protein [Methylobacterium sp. 37f]